MTDKKLLALAAVLTLGLGLAWILFPNELLRAWGAGSNDIRE